MGRAIYLSDNEIKAIRECCEEWCDILSEGEKSAIQVGQILEEGLGSALYKLYKGCNGARLYEKYIKK